MTLYVLMTHPAYHQDDILGGNGLGVTRAVQRALMGAGIDGERVEFHGFAGADFLTALQLAAPAMGAECHVIGCEGLTRIDKIVQTGDRTEYLHKNFRPDSYVVHERDFYAMLDQLKARLRPGDTLLVTGSRPVWAYDAEFDVDWDAITAELYIGFPRWAQELGVYVAIDTVPRNPSEPDAPPGPLELVFASTFRPDLAKMNSTEWAAVTAQFLAAHRQFADEIGYLEVDSPEWRLRVAKALMPDGFLVVSFKKNLFAYLNGQGLLLTLNLPEKLRKKYAKRWVTSVGRGDTVMGTLLALRKHKSILGVLKRALAARAAQTFFLLPGVYAIEDAVELKKHVDATEIVKVEQGQPVPA